MKKVGLFIMPLMALSFLAGCVNQAGGYTITWVNYNDEVLEVDKHVKKGEMPHFDSATPTKPDEESYSYIFCGWNPELKEVTQSTTYKATFEAVTNTTKIKISFSKDDVDKNFSFTYEANSDIEVKWGDGEENSESSHTYANPGEYEILIKNITNLSFCKESSEYNDIVPTEGASNVDEIYLSEIVTSINNDAFSRCLNISKIDISNRVTRIGDYAFPDSDNLICEDDGKALYLGNESNPYLVLLMIKSDQCESVTDYVINEKCKFIMNYSFNECEKLKSVVMPNGIISVGFGAFSCCYLLKSINIPSSVTSIGGEVFYNCEALTNVTIPDSVTSIGERAFYGCAALTNITIPGSVTYIKESTFYNCSSLTDLIMLEGVTYIDSGAFANCSSLTNVSLPNSISVVLDGGGLSPSNDRPNLNFNVDDEGFKYLGNEDNPYVALMGAPDPIELTTYDVKPGCKVVNSNMFDSDVGLEYVSLPNSLTYTGYAAFDTYDYSNLYDDGSCKYLGNDSNQKVLLCFADEEIDNCEIQSGCKAIRSYAFYNVDWDITKITIPSSVVSIGENAFNDLGELSNVVMSEGLIFISEYAFQDCKSLTNVAIPSTAKIVESCAFEGCTDLCNVDLSAYQNPNDIPVCFDDTFSGCSKKLKFEVANREMAYAFMHAGEGWPMFIDHYVW